MSLPVIYIAAPLSADTLEGVNENRRVASLWAAWAALSGYSPSCSWIVLTGVLTEEHRELGLRCDCAAIEKCDGVFLVGGRISSGMTIERRHANKCLVPVYDLTPLGRLPPMPVDTARLRGLIERCQREERDARAEMDTVPYNEPPTMTCCEFHDELFGASKVEDGDG